MNHILTLIVLLILSVGCSKQNSFYSQAPSELSDEAKPIFLGRKFLNEGNEEGFMAVLSNDTLQKYLNEKDIDPEYFQKLRKLEYDEREYRYFTINEWRDFVDKEDEAMSKYLRYNGEANQAVVISYHESGSRRGHGPSYVVKENGEWKAITNFKPL